MRKRIVLYLTAALISVACIAQDAHKKIDRETLREKILKKNAKKGGHELWQRKA